MNSWPASVKPLIAPVVNSNFAPVLRRDDHPKVETRSTNADDRFHSFGCGEKIWYMHVKKKLFRQLKFLHNISRTSDATYLAHFCPLCGWLLTNFCLRVLGRCSLNNCDEARNHLIWVPEEGAGEEQDMLNLFLVLVLIQDDVDGRWHF